MKPRTRLVFALSASFGAILIAAVLYGIPSFTVHATGQPPAVLDKLIMSAITAAISLGVGLMSCMLSGTRTEGTMGMMIIRHKVRDYGQWGPIFDRHTEMQKAAGLSNPRM